jgi:hypothetical protein
MRRVGRSWQAWCCGLLLLGLDGGCSLRDLSDLRGGGDGDGLSAGRGGVGGDGGGAPECAVGDTELSCIPLNEDVAYALHPTHAPTKCIAPMMAGVSPGTTIVQADCDSTVSQKFWLTAEEGDLLTIRSAWSALCLQATAASTAPSAAVVQDACVSAAAEHWSVVVREGGFSLVQSQSGLVLDVAGAAVTDSGVALQQSTYDPSPDMLWQFEETTGGTLGLQPYGQEGSYVSLVDGTARVVGGDSSVGRWKLVPGLGDPKCVSIEVPTESGVYLRHLNFVLRTGSDDGTSGFLQDATFCFRDGLKSVGFDRRSFESRNFPGRYLAARSDGQVMLENLVDSDDFRTRATWILVGN